MNVDYFLEDLDAPKEITVEVIQELFEIRKKIFLGFKEREDTKGPLAKFNRDFVDLNTSWGQDLVRGYLFRIIEELTEALEAESPSHFYEELIDSINYLWGLLYLINAPEYVVDETIQGIADVFTEVGPSLMIESDILVLEILKHVCYKLPDRLRNRSWMNVPQQILFDGWHEVTKAVVMTSALIYALLEYDWVTFYTYYIAKNQVLEFRLQTNY